MHVLVKPIFEDIRDYLAELKKTDGLGITRMATGHC